ncbi:TIM barrel protein [Streptomyces sp. SID8379]|uniref:sugar phosphate isomerase/epimerase family protein n=1 Tax=unclassified Streptomyces TaxID=2593676 RepID=UPI00037A361E|nr:MULTISPECIES: sugar phosphate isomerase/epimerase [unclassified Streptomyces]MYW63159.1 TIM barrel protein [Streptomyces sp. SID8379]
MTTGHPNTRSGAAVRIANAPVSYGIYAPDAAPLDPDALLASFDEAGYEGTDLGPLGYLGTGDELVGRLARHRQALAGGWVDLRYGDPEGFAADLPGLDAALDIFTAASVDDERFAPRPTLACPGNPARFAAPGLPVDPALQLTDADWPAFAADVQRAADRVRARGLEPVFHPHLGTDVETPDEIRRLLDLTDVSLCLDTAHLWLAGGDPVEAIRAWGPRLRQVHLKDASRAAHAAARADGGDLWRTVGDGGFTALGRGDLDFGAIAEALDAIAYTGWIVVEQDALATGQDLTVITADQRANLALLRSLPALG